MRAFDGMMITTRDSQRLPIFLIIETFLHKMEMKDRHQNNISQNNVVNLASWWSRHQSTVLIKLDYLSVTSGQCLKIVKYGSIFLTGTREVLACQNV